MIVSNDPPKDFDDSSAVAEVVPLLPSGVKRARNENCELKEEPDTKCTDESTQLSTR